MGRVAFAVAGTGPVARAVAKDVAVLPASDAAVDVAFHVAARTQPLPGTPLPGLRRMAASAELGGPHPIIHVRPELPASERLVPRGLYRMAHPAHIDQADHAAQLFSYQVFDGAIQALGLRRDQSFLHAAAVERDGRRVALVAGGGMGKTGTMLRLVVQEGWRYVSDDWTVIEGSGVILPSAKALQVFPRNLAVLDDGERLLIGRRPAADRAAWRVHRSLGGRGGLRRKVTAADLFGAERVAPAGPLDEVLVIRRADVERIDAHPTEPGEVSAHVAGVVAKELAPSVAVLAPILGDLADLADAGDTAGASLASATETTLARALSACATTEVVVPRQLPEPAIEAFLIDRLTR